MKKKGFTLVELLAVIAILAILVIMALPAVLRMFTQARKDLFENEVREMYKTSQKQFLSDSMLNSGQKILYTNAESCSPTGVDSVRSLNMTGNSNLKYYILVNTDGKVLNVRASNGTYSYAIKAIGTSRPIQIENIEIETNNQVTLDSDITNTLCPSEAEIYYPVIADCVTEGCTKTAAETELIIAGERFYVVSSETDGNTVLLSKYDLRQDGNSYIQDTNENSRTNLVQANFLDNNNTAYWDGAQCVYNSGWSCTGRPVGLISPYNDGGASYCSSVSGTNCAYVYDENAVNIFPVVNAYAKKISNVTDVIVTGRLLSLEEANSLSTNVRKDMHLFNYWLGSARADKSMWYVSYYGGDGSMFTDYPYNTFGIRPVIIVSTSAL